MSIRIAAVLLILGGVLVLCRGLFLVPALFRQLDSPLYVLLQNMLITDNGRNIVAHLAQAFLNAVS